MTRFAPFFAAAMLMMCPLADLQAKPVTGADGWTTNTDFPLLGDPQALKGGSLKSHWPSYPPTLRTEGPNSNLSTTRSIHGLIYESMLALHPETLEYVPVLASHWKMSEDKRKFWFKINPKASWADGSPVTAEDVVATWEWLARKDIKDPYTNMFATDNFEKPVAESKYVVSVKTKKLHWRLFYYFGGMSIYPAQEMSKLTGDEYLDKYNWKLQMGSGPYELKPEGIKKEHSVTVSKRNDYWAKDRRMNIGANNFDKITWIVVMDEELAFEKFKKGELDYYHVLKAQRWAEECDFDKVKKGWIKKRKIYTKAPEGFSGFVFNMRKPPFDDRNVRKAFAFLFNRERLIDKLFFNQYEHIDSYYPGNVWGNPKNPKIRHNPRMAARLLKRAGYEERNKDGWLVKDGKPFEITLEYAGGASWTRIHKVIQEDIQKAGIKMNLNEIDPRTLMKKVSERSFTLHLQSWGALLFPNPISSWDSKLADKQHNNNLPGFKDPEVDKLCEEYDKTFDRQKQIEIVRKIDRLIFRQHPYALGWYANFTRLLHWDKFGHPDYYFSKVGDYRDIKTLWWKDPAREKALAEAKASGKTLPQGEVVQKPWED
ncbi:extracellular solute-binding protein [Elusimicrobiota bacterium]